MFLLLSVFFIIYHANNTRLLGIDSVKEVKSKRFLSEFAGVANALGRKLVASFNQIERCDHGQLQKVANPV